MPWIGSGRIFLLAWALSAKGIFFYFAFISVVFSYSFAGNEFYKNFLLILIKSKKYHIFSVGVQVIFFWVKVFMWCNFIFLKVFFLIVTNVCLFYIFLVFVLFCYLVSAGAISPLRHALFDSFSDLSLKQADLWFWREPFVIMSMSSKKLNLLLIFSSVRSKVFFGGGHVWEAVKAVNELVCSWKTSPKDFWVTRFSAFRMEEHLVVFIFYAYFA